MTTPTIKSASPACQTTFKRVGECLWRNNITGIYYAFVKRRGKQFHHSLKTTDRALAERRLATFREKVAHLSPSKEANTITFGALADRWLKTVSSSMKPRSALRQAACTKQLKKYLASIKLRNISARDCDEWVIKRGKAISPASFNKERDTLNQILRFAVRDGLILTHPASHIKRRKLGTPRLLMPTQDQFALLINTLREGDPRAAEAVNLLELLAYSGMRLSEATSLLWGDMDLDRNCFTVTGGETGTKNHEARTVPMFPAMRTFVEKLRAENTFAPSERVISIDSAKKSMASACRIAKLPHFHHHSLRHYFVSNAIEAGVDFKVIAGWVGHKDGGVLVPKRTDICEMPTHSKWPNG